MKDRLYIASVSQNAPDLAKAYGIGLELDYYCMAANMDEPLFGKTKEQVARELEAAGSRRLIFHAPFNELYPAAIDPQIQRIAYKRYEQAYHLAKDVYGIEKMVVHSGYVPRIYYKQWHHEKSLEFWRAYMRNKQGSFTICIENVLEDEPYMFAEIAEELDQENIRLCLDIGHANCIGNIPLEEWIRVTGPYVSHLHIHSNNGEHDYHDALGEGTIQMARALEQIDRYCGKDATITIESLDGTKSLEWLDKEGYLK